MVGNAIAQSAQPIISYNFGAGVRERVIEAAQIALATAVVCGAAVTAVFIAARACSSGSSSIRRRTLHASPSRGYHGSPWASFVLSSI